MIFLHLFQHHLFRKSQLLIKLLYNLLHCKANRKYLYFISYLLLYQFSATHRAIIYLKELTWLISIIVLSFYFNI
nr:MAG TPA: hypothetical protein [Caudoviricetes sp.]